MARRPTIIDVAQAAGVSKATVARVLNGNAEMVRPVTRARVVEVAQQLGYERNAVAGSLRTDQTYLIALFIPDITNPFWPEVARGVQDVMDTAGYAAVTMNSDWKADRELHLLQIVRRNRFDGLIINPAAISNDALTQLHIPVIILGNGERYPDLDAVGSATEVAVQELLTHLFEFGHRRIGLITGQARQQKGHLRYQSYREFHQRHHLPIDDHLIIETVFNPQSGFVAMHRLLDLPSPPTAVFAANDILAIGALKAARERGCRVPEEVSIVGMDDIYAAAMTSPALTTIAKPKYETGATAARLLLGRLEGNTHAPQHIQLPAHLVQRDSVSSPFSF